MIIENSRGSLRDSKWFVIYEDSRTFESKYPALNIEEAWEKTFEKWNLVAEGYIFIGMNSSIECCGLCNLFRNLRCEGCPIKIKTGRNFCFCTPNSDYNNDLSIDKRISIAMCEIEFLNTIYEENEK